MRVLVAGSGISGVTAARLLADAGHEVVVYECRDHFGGNCYDEKHGGVMVHRYGPHLFHTNDRAVWEFLSRFTEWTEYRHRVVGDTALGRISIPYSPKTEAQLGRALSDAEIRDLIFVQYSQKQWGVPWDQMPAAIIGRVPTRRADGDERYFTDEFQGQPKDGYARMFERMLGKIPLHLGVEKDAWRATAAAAKLVIYTGKIDEYFNCRYGRLPYRSLRFEHFWSPDRLAHAVINQCNDLPYTRFYDHLYFSENAAPGLPAEPQAKAAEPLWPANAVPLSQRHEKLGGTVLTREFPHAHDETNEPYYPMPFGQGMELYQKYKLLATAESNTIFLGRLATYSYLDMWMVVAQARVKIRPHLTL